MRLAPCWRFFSSSSFSNYLMLFTWLSSTPLMYLSLSVHRCRFLLVTHRWSCSVGVCLFCCCLFVCFGPFRSHLNSFDLLVLRHLQSLLTGFCFIKENSEHCETLLKHLYRKPWILTKTILTWGLWCACSGIFHRCRGKRQWNNKPFAQRPFWSQTVGVSAGVSTDDNQGFCSKEVKKSPDSALEPVGSLEKARPRQAEYILCIAFVSTSIYFL